MPNWGCDKSDEFNESTPESKAPQPRLNFGIGSEDPVPSSSAKYSGTSFVGGNFQVSSSNGPVNSSRYDRSVGQSGSASGNSVRDRCAVKIVAAVEKVVTSCPSSNCSTTFSELKHSLRHSPIRIEY